MITLRTKRFERRYGFMSLVNHNCFNEYKSVLIFWFYAVFKIIFLTIYASNYGTCKDFSCPLVAYNQLV